MTLLLSLITASDFERSYLAYVKKWARTWILKRRRNAHQAAVLGGFYPGTEWTSTEEIIGIYMCTFSICICKIHSVVVVLFFCSQLTHELSLTWSVAHLVTLPRPLQTSFLPFDSECFFSAILAYGRPEWEDVKTREE